MGWGEHVDMVSTQYVNIGGCEGGQARGSWVIVHLGTLRKSLPSSVVNSRMM